MHWPCSPDTVLKKGEKSDVFIDIRGAVNKFLEQGIRNAFSKIVSISHFTLIPHDLHPHGAHFIYSFSTSRIEVF